MIGRYRKRGRPPAKETTIKIRFKQSVFEMWRNEKQASGYGHYSIFTEYLLHCGPGKTISTWLQSQHSGRGRLLDASTYCSSPLSLSTFLAKSRLPLSLVQQNYQQLFLRLGGKLTYKILQTKMQNSYKVKPLFKLRHALKLNISQIANKWPTIGLHFL